jgi:DNA polymerase III epsilon subunit-like protein
MNNIKSGRADPAGKERKTVIWCDTETTGFEPADSGAFEIAFLVYGKGEEFLGEKVYHLNPLNETVKFGSKAYKVNGVPEETIRSYPPAEKVIPEIVEFLRTRLSGTKLVLAGYYCGFDYKHLKALVERYGFSMSDLFTGELIDVYEMVKRACSRGLLPWTPNKKLETMTKTLQVPHDGAHTALSDIWAARRLYETIYRMGRRKL